MHAFLSDFGELSQLPIIGATGKDKHTSYASGREKQRAYAFSQKCKNVVIVAQSWAKQSKSTEPAVDSVMVFLILP